MRSAPASLSASEVAQATRALAAAVRFASVSATPVAAPALSACAMWFGAWMRALGFASVELTSPALGVPPLVYGSWRPRDRRPSVLIYGHYDVQPPGALDAWLHPPFAGVVADGAVHGRGSADNKSQIVAALMACQLLLRRRGELPVNVVFLLDGEEEIGSPHLAEHLLRQPPPRVDAVVISDSLMKDGETPTVIQSLRGILSLEINATRAGSPVHAGTFGGIVADPIAALVRAVAEIYRADDDARSDAVTVTGFAGGALVPGPTSTIATRARARLDVRIGPGQDAPAIARAYYRRLTRAPTAGVALKVRTLAAAAPTMIDPRHHLVRLGMQVLHATYQRAPALVRSGGTVPAASLLGAALGQPALLLGCVPPDARIHAPNERMSIAALAASCRVFMNLFDELGQGLRRSPRKRSSQGARHVPDLSA